MSSWSRCLGDVATLHPVGMPSNDAAYINQGNEDRAGLAHELSTVPEWLSWPYFLAGTSVCSLTAPSGKGPEGPGVKHPCANPGG